MIERRGDTLRGVSIIMPNNNQYLVDDAPHDKVVRRSEPTDSTRSSRRHGRPPVKNSWRLADAKTELQTRYGISETTSHVILQRFSQECRMPFEEAADIIRLGLMTLDILRETAGDGSEAE